MYHLRRASITAVLLAFLLFLIWLVPRALNPNKPTDRERDRDEHWVDSSPYWLDRQACRWLALCGLHHIKPDPPVLLGKNEIDGDGDKRDLRWIELRKRWQRRADYSKRWEYATSPRKQNSKRARARDGAKILQHIPDYVLVYAPLVHLYSRENFWPSDIAEHVRHMAPFVNGSALNTSGPVDLDNLHELDKVPGGVFLTSQDDVESRPEWLHSHANIPTPFEDDGEDGGGDDGDDDDDDDPRDDEWRSRDDQKRPDEGTTWWDADKDHPPHRISDPRRLSYTPPALRRLSHAKPQQDTHPPPSSYSPDTSGYSHAPAVLVLVDKGSGILDAFWFFFYSYNLGQTVSGIRFGNHVGDWEHCMMRFEHGQPRAMFLSEHEGGKAYVWGALEKRQPPTYSPMGLGRENGSNPGFAFDMHGHDPPSRPVIYSAVGSHAMYASPGDHPYVLPFDLLRDVTDRGPLWDPALNTYAYWYDYEADGDVKTGSHVEGANDDDDDFKEPNSLTPVAENPRAPTSWFHFSGPWGDELYPLRDERQWRLFGQYHYGKGPLGPKFKRLNRHRMCQTERCRILRSLEEGKKSSWYN